MPKWYDIREPREEDALVTVKEFAERTRMAEVTVRALVREHVIPAIRLPGGHIRIRKSTLDAYLTPKKNNL